MIFENIIYNTLVTTIVPRSHPIFAIFGVFSSNAADEIPVLSALSRDPACAKASKKELKNFIGVVELATAY